ncbi:TPA: major capsid protein, partial [Escherichia coli]
MVDLYSPTQLVQVANAEDVQKKLNALFTSLFFTRSVMFESRDIILDTIDDPN